ncbi:Wide host range VirA protein [Aquimixticola soesokkakensis]|uniref:histidine kinase n=1 Tax=Aquimixticola soesokkakensis TaxID=1519096 RepID=A0A1Y5TH42_9RHOB|nr:ATP-binding protein [Aquimixticola soesokkakensis]SLN63660.1 Wide host range VirA protein [Aquimixticola soesokkakensis]
MSRLFSLDQLPLPKAGQTNRWVVVGLLVAVQLISWAVLVLGYGANLEVFVRLDRDFPSTVPLTAVSLLVLGVASALPARIADGQSGYRWLTRTQQRAGQGLRSLLACGVGLFAGHKLVVALLWIAQIDLTRDRIAIGTSLCLVLTSMGILLGQSVRIWAVTARMALCSLAFGLGLFALVLLVFRYDPLWQDAILSGMAFYTALCITLLNLVQLLDGTQLRRAAAAQLRFPVGLIVLPLGMVVPLGLFATLASHSQAMNSNTFQTVSYLAFSLSLGVVVINAAGAFRAWHVRFSALKERRTLLAILNALSGAVFVIQDRNRPPLVNQRAEDLSGADIAAVDWLERAQFHSLYHRAVLSGKDHPVNRLFDPDHGGKVFAGWIDGDGVERALEFSRRVVQPDPDAAPLNVIEILDETESWRVRENLSLVEKLSALGEMASGLAHEMSNIFGVVQLASDTGMLVAKSPAARRQFEAIQSACHRGGVLTSQLLRLGGQEHGVPEVIDLLKKLERVGVLARVSVPADIAIVIETPEGETDLQVFCNPAELAGTLFNAVLNARNALSDAAIAQGTITIGLRRVTLDDGPPPLAGFEISVDDNGPGFEPEIQDKLFDPYFTTRHDKGGTGLGLALARDFATRAGGSVTLEAGAQGGASFRLILPAAQPMAPQDSGQDALSLEGYRLLLVAPPENFDPLTPYSLRSLGADVYTADTVDAAHAIVPQARPHVLLIDSGLTQTQTGAAFVAQLRARLPTCGLISMQSALQAVRAFKDQEQGRAPDLGVKDPGVQGPGGQDLGLKIDMPVGLDVLVNSIRLCHPLPEAPPAAD